MISSTVFYFFGLVLFLGGTTAYCPRIYDPVCGVRYHHHAQRHTFGNECLLNEHNENHPEYAFYIEHRGECQHHHHRCNAICTAEYRPVCARSTRTGLLKTFSNQCVLNRANCNTYGPHYHFLHAGECGGYNGVYPGAEYSHLTNFIQSPTVPAI